jgi:hypothetical protein
MSAGDCRYFDFERNGIEIDEEPAENCAVLRQKNLDSPQRCLCASRSELGRIQAERNLFRFLYFSVRLSQDKFPIVRNDEMKILVSLQLLGKAVGIRPDAVE